MCAQYIMNQFHIAERPCCGILPSREDQGTTGSASHAFFAESGEAILGNSFCISA